MIVFIICTGVSVGQRDIRAVSWRVPSVRVSSPVRVRLVLVSLYIVKDVWLECCMTGTIFCFYCKLNASVLWAYFVKKIMTKWMLLLFFHFLLYVKQCEICHDKIVDKVKRVQTSNKDEKKFKPSKLQWNLFFGNKSKLILLLNPGVFNLL